MPQHHHTYCKDYTLSFFKKTYLNKTNVVMLGLEQLNANVDFVSIINHLK